MKKKPKSIDDERQEKEEQQQVGQMQEYVKRAQKRHRYPYHMGDVVNQLMGRRGYARFQQSDQLNEIWESAVGPEIASVSKPGNLRRGVLEVIVSNSVVMQELTFAKPGLIHAVNQQFHQSIRDIRFRTGPT